MQVMAKEPTTKKELKEADLKIARVTNSFISNQPFYAYMLLRMKQLLDDDQPTAYTDGKLIGWNPRFLNGMKIKQALTVCAHEVLHVTLGHHLRGKGFEHRRWNMACDYYINLLLSNAGFEPVDGWLLDHKYAGMSEEAIYRLLKPQGEGEGEGEGQGEGEGNGGNGQGGGQQGSNSGNGSGAGTYQSPTGEVLQASGDGGRELTDAEITAALTELQRGVAQAAQAARSRGLMPAELETAIGTALKSKIDYRDVLEQFVQNCLNGGYDWNRGSSTWLSYDIWLPSLRSKRLPKFAVAIDTSGSVSDKALAMFEADIRNIFNLFPAAECHIIYCDAAVSKVDVVTADTFEGLKPVGRGGTAFTPVFDYIAEEGIDPKFLIYYTDLYGDEPQEPEYPTLWVSLTENMQGPFGETVYADVND